LKVVDISAHKLDVVKRKSDGFNCIISLENETILKFHDDMEYNLRAGDMIILKDEDVVINTMKPFLFLSLETFIA